MRRRYTPARNPIEALRDRWGLGDTDPAQSVPTGQGPGIGVHPLPLTAREAPAPYSFPLPRFPGDVFSDHPAPSDSGTVDYEARQRGQLETVGQGGISEPVNVYPNWESRLEGMRDFLAVGRPDLGELTLIATPGSYTLDVYTVPQGYTAFLKRFRYFFVPVPGGVDEINCEASLLVDGIIVQDYFNLPLGAFMAGYEDCFVIAAQGRVLQLQLNFLDAVGDIDLNATALRVLFYGNVRKRTGEPENRDVGVRPPPAPEPVVMPAAAAPVSDSPPFVVEWKVIRSMSHASATRKAPSQAVPFYPGGKTPLSQADRTKYAAYLMRTAPKNYGAIYQPSPKGSISS